MHPQQPEPMDAMLDDAARSKLEHALAGLPLREPSAALDARVAQALADASSMPPAEAESAPAAIPFPGAAAHRSRWLTGLAVAAVVALLMSVGLTAYFQPGGWASPDQPEMAELGPDAPSSVQPDTDVLPTPGPQQPEVVRAGYKFQEEPVQLHWTRDIDAGVLTAENAQPVRAVRRQDVEQRVWVDPERGVTVQVTRPRERLMVVKQPTF